MKVVSEVTNTVFGGVWKLLLGVEFPGIGVSIAAVVVALVLIRFSIRIFGFFTGFHAGGGDYGRASNAIDKYKAKQAKEDF